MLDVGPQDTLGLGDVGARLLRDGNMVEHEGGPDPDSHRRAFDGRGPPGHQLIGPRDAYGNDRLAQRKDEPDGAGTEGSMVLSHVRSPSG